MRRGHMHVWPLLNVVWVMGSQNVLDPEVTPAFSAVSSWSDHPWRALIPGEKRANDLEQKHLLWATAVMKTQHYSLVPNSALLLTIINTQRLHVNNSIIQNRSSKTSERLLNADNADKSDFINGNSSFQFSPKFLLPACISRGIECVCGGCASVPKHLKHAYTHTAV